MPPSEAGGRSQPKNRRMSASIESASKENAPLAAPFPASRVRVSPGIFQGEPHRYTPGHDLAGDMSAPGLWQVGLWALAVLRATLASTGLLPPDSGEDRHARWKYKMRVMQAVQRLAISRRVANSYSAPPCDSTEKKMRLTFLAA